MFREKTREGFMVITEYLIHVLTKHKPNLNNVNGFIIQFYVYLSIYLDIFQHI